MSKPSFLAELKRRNVIRMAGLYFVGAWLVTQVAGTVLPMFGAPEWLPRSVVALLGIGFIPALIFAWVFEITPEGLKRESEIDRAQSITPDTGQRMDRAIIVALVLAVVVFAVDRFVLAPKRQAQAVAEALAKEKGGGVAGSVASNGLASALPDAAGAIPTIEADPSIAVLPMLNLSEDKANEYFSDGISEELLNLLAKVPKLRVIARTSSFKFKGKDVSIDDVARQLHVAAVLEGSIRKSNDRVRITVQLIRAIDGTHLWSETYDRTLDDVFKVQDEIAAAVVGQLKIKLLGAVPTARPVDTRIYPDLLRAQALNNLGTPEGWAQAIGAFQRVLEIAPDEERAWTGLARVYVNQGITAERPAAEAARLAREAAQKALAINPDSAEGEVYLASVIEVFDNDLAGAVPHYQRALQLDPNNLRVLSNAAVVLQNFNQLEKATLLFQRVVERDPANAINYGNLAIIHLSRARWDDAIATARRALSLSPDYIQVRGTIATALLLGKHDAAAGLAEIEHEPDAQSRKSTRPLLLQALGRQAEAARAMEEWLAEFAPRFPFQTASIYTAMGDRDRGFEWLERAIQQRDPALQSIASDITLHGLHDDPRWLPLLRKVGKAPEQLAKIEFTVNLPE